MGRTKRSCIALLSNLALLISACGTQACEIRIQGEERRWPLKEANTLYEAAQAEAAKPKGNLSDAISSLSTALAADTTFAPVHAARARLLQQEAIRLEQRGNFTAALQSCAAAIWEEPERSETVALLQRLLQHERRSMKIGADQLWLADICRESPQARCALYRLALGVSDDPDVREQLADTLRVMGRDDLATIEFQRAMMTRTRRKLLEAAHKLEKKGDFAGAAHALLKGLGDRTTDSLNMRRALVRDCEQFAKLHPGADSYYELGRAYHNTFDAEHEITSLKKALTYKPAYKYEIDRLIYEASSMQKDQSRQSSELRHWDALEAASRFIEQRNLEAAKLAYRRALDWDDEMWQWAVEEKSSDGMSISLPGVGMTLAGRGPTGPNSDLWNELDKHRFEVMDTTAVKGLARTFAAQGNYRVAVNLTALSLPRARSFGPTLKQDSSFLLADKFTDQAYTFADEDEDQLFSTLCMAYEAKALDGGGIMGTEERLSQEFGIVPQNFEELSYLDIVSHWRGIHQANVQEKAFDAFVQGISDDTGMRRVVDAKNAWRFFCINGLSSFKNAQLSLRLGLWCARKCGDSDKIDATFNALATELIARGDYVEAETLLNECVDDLIKHNSRSRALAFSRYSLGYARFKQGKLTEAEHEVEPAVSFFDEQNDAIATAYGNALLAGISVAEGADPEKRKSFFWKASQCFFRGGDKNYGTQFLRYAAITASAGRGTSDAETLNRLLCEYDKRESADDLLQDYLRLAQINLARGERLGAQEWMKTAATVVTEVGCTDSFTAGDPGSQYRWTGLSDIEHIDDYIMQCMFACRRLPIQFVSDCQLSYQELKKQALP